MNDKVTKKPTRRRRAPTLPRGARWATRLLVTLPLLALLITAGFYFAALGRLLNANLAPVVAAEAGRQLHREVRLGRVVYLTPGSLTLTDVAVSSKDTWARSRGESALTADRVTITYSLYSLIVDNHNATHALGDIILDRPNALVERFSNKQFNFSDLLQPQNKPPQKPFAGRIVVRNGTLRFRDFLAPARLAARPAYNTLAAVNASVSFQSERYVTFQGEARGTDTRLTTVAINGDASRLTAGRFRISLHAGNADAVYWSRYFTSLSQATVTAGRGDLALTLERLGSKPPPGLPLDLLGQIVIRHGQVVLTDRHLLRRPLQDISGAAMFTDANVSGDLHLTLAGQPLDLHGQVLSFSHPQLALTATSPRLDPRRLAVAVPVLALPGSVHIVSGPATVQFTGPLSNPAITADAVFPSVVYAGNQATNVQAHAFYAGRVLAVPSLTFRMAGGAALLRATVANNGARPRIQMEGQVQGLNLAALRLPPSAAVKTPGLGGVASVAFLADNQGHPLSVTANVNIVGAQLRETTLRSVQGRVVWVQGQPVTLSRMMVADDKGMAAVSGTIPLGNRAAEWNLHVNAGGMDLGRLLKPYHLADVDGLAAFQGRVTGPASAPQAAGGLQLANARYGRFGIDTAHGAVTVSTNGVRLNDLIVRRFPTAAHVSGTITRLASKNPEFGLKVALSQGDVQDFVNLANQVGAPPTKAPTKAARVVAEALPTLTGTAAGTFEVTGRLNALQIAGQAQITDATVGAYRVDEARANVTYGSNLLRVENATILAQGAIATAHGQWQTKTGRLQGAFAAENINLDRFRHQLYRYADVDAIVAVSGAVGGTVKAPAADVTLAARNISVNGQNLAPLTVSARYEDGILTKIGDPWVLTVLGQGPDQAEIKYVVDDLHLTFPTATHLHRPSMLALAAHIPAEAPEQVVHLLATVRQSRLAATPQGQQILARLDRLPRPLDGVIALPKLTVDGPLDALALHADLQMGNLIVGENRLRQLMAHVDYANQGNPDIHVVARGADLSVVGVPVNTIDAQMDYQNRVITVSRLHATNERAFLDAAGKADLDGDMAATLDASNVPLALFNVFLPHTRALSGEVSALSVAASGPTQSPNLIASVNLSNPAVTLHGPQNQVRSIYGLDRIRSGEITLASAAPGAAKVLSISDLSGFKNGKTVVTISGTLPVRLGSDTMAHLPPGEPLHAEMRIQDMSLLALFSPLIDPAKTAGTLVASVDAAPAAGQSGIVGTVNVSDMSVGLAGFDTSLTKINGRIVFSQDRVTVQTFTGQSSRGGNFAMTGGGTLGVSGGAHQLQLVMNNLTVDETSRQSLLYKTYSTGIRGKINGKIRMDGPWLTPTIATPPAAPVTVTDASGTIPSAPAQSGTPSGPPSFDPRFNVVVALGSAGKTVALRSSLLAANADGDVELTGHLAAPELRAHLNIYGGQFILPPSTRLKFIRPVGVVDVAYPVPTPDPTGIDQPGLQTRVDLWAQGNVTVSPAVLAANQSAVSGGGVATPSQIGESAPYQAPAYSGNTLSQSLSQSQRYVITAHILGTLNDPNHLNLILSSSPPGLNQGQMLAALSPESAVLGLTGANSQGAVKTILAQVFSDVAFPGFETGVEQALGLSSFSLDYSPDAPAVVTLSKLLAPRLEVTYTSQLGGRASGAVNSVVTPPQYTLKLGYSIGPRLQIGISTDDQRNTTATLEGVFNF